MLRTTRTFDLAEGPRWFHDRWYFVNVLEGQLFSLADSHLTEVDLVLDLELPLGAVAAIDGEGPGAWISAVGDGIAHILDGEVTWLDRPEQGGPVATRMNDAVCDPRGRFWAGSMGYEAEEGAGSLYRTDLDGTVTRVLDGITIPNGPAFTPDGATMYLADSARGQILRFPVDEATGVLGVGEPFVLVADASPDGMVLDDDGHLWVAMWGGGRVDRFSPDGQLTSRLPLASTQPSSPCFGGVGGRELLVTSASHGLDAPNAADGAVWLTEAAVSGPTSRVSAVRP